MLDPDLAAVIIVEVFESPSKPQRIIAVEGGYSGPGVGNFDRLIPIKRAQRIARQDIVLRGENLVAGVRESCRLKQHAKTCRGRLVGAANNELRLRDVDVRCNESEIDCCKQRRG